MIIDDSIVIIYPACLILSLVISTAVLIFLRGHTLTPGAVSIRWMMVCLVIWLFGALLEIVSDRYTLQYVALNIQYVGKAFVPYSWFVFAYKYSGRDEKLTRRVLFLLAVIPMVSILMGCTNDLHHLMWREISQQSIDALPLLIKEYGPWSLVTTPYNYLLIVAGTVVIGIRFSGDAYLYRFQSASLLAALLIPLALNIMYYLGLFLEGIDLTPCAFSVSGLILATAFFKLHLFNLRPVAYNTIVENMNSAMIVLDSLGRITGLNRTAESILGLSLKQVIGKQLDDLPNINQEIIRFLDNPEDSAKDIVINQGNNREIYGARLTQLYDRSHHPIGQLFLLDNITARRAIERKNRELEEQVNQANLFAAAGEVADIAHEINNPLTSIISLSDFLMTHDIPEHITKDVKVIRDAAKQAAEVTSRLLNFTGNFEAGREPVDINQVIDSTLRLRSRSLTNNNITVIRQFDSGLPKVLAGFSQLQQVFLNLILNAESAIKEYRAEGSIVITTRQAGNQIVISVRDDGPGIPESNIEKIFEHFFTTKAPGQGTGLGLNICRRIVQQLGGTIHAESDYGHGAEFIIRLPVADTAGDVMPDEQQSGEPAGQVAPPAASPREHARIITVDDEPLILYVLEQLLKEEGYEVIQFIDALDALDEMKKNDFDLALVDVKMPGMSGMELHNELKGVSAGAAGKLIFITGDNIGMGTGKFFSTTNVRYVMKPFDPVKLTAFIRETLRHRTGE